MYNGNMYSDPETDITVTVERLVVQTVEVSFSPSLLSADAQRGTLEDVQRASKFIAQDILANRSDEMLPSTHPVRCQLLPAGVPDPESGVPDMLYANIESVAFETPGDRDQMWAIDVRLPG